MLVKAVFNAGDAACEELRDEVCAVNNDSAGAEVCDEAGDEAVFFSDKACLAILKRQDGLHKMSSDRKSVV